jgi:hypothetical protein
VLEQDCPWGNPPFTVDAWFQSEASTGERVAISIQERSD